MLRWISRQAMSIPETRYAKSGDVHIAYQVVGDGPFGMVLGIAARARFLQGLPRSAG